MRIVFIYLNAHIITFLFYDNISDKFDIIGEVALLAEVKIKISFRLKMC